MDSPTIKMVNGELVPLTNYEIDYIMKERNDAAIAYAQSFVGLVSAGYDTGLGWFLPIDDVSRAALIQLRGQLVEGIDLGAWTMDSQCPVEILDINGNSHQLTVGQARQIIFLAGNYYAGLVARFR